MATSSNTAKLEHPRLARSAFRRLRISRWMHLAPWSLLQQVRSPMPAAATNHNDD